MVDRAGFGFVIICIFCNCSGLLLVVIGPIPLGLLACQVVDFAHPGAPGCQCAKSADFDSFVIFVIQTAWPGRSGRIWVCNYL